MNDRRKPYVFVTPQGPDDGGDFGPNTPRTTTSGIQEALDYAHEYCRDVYVWGGRGGMHAGVFVPNPYTLHETLRVPWNQDFRLDGGNYHLIYTEDTGDAITIDSQMNCRYKFGLIECRSDGAAVRIKPETAGPDDMVVITASVFDFSAVCSRGTGILIDSSKGPVINSKVFAEETNTLGKGVHLTDAGGSAKGVIQDNLIQVMYTNQYHATGGCAGLQIGDPASAHIIHNRIESSVHAPMGVYFDEETKKYTAPQEFQVPEDAIGIEIFAQDNLFTLAFYGKRAPGKDIVFQPAAKDNTVFVFGLPNGITNKATIPTNRIIPNWPVGFDVSTPALPASGAYLVNTSSYLVQVFILTPGEVSDWTIADAKGTSQTFAGALQVGQTFLLEPGDKAKFTYSKAPTWKWKALR